MTDVAQFRRRKVWGWGYEDEEASHDEVRRAGEAARAHLGFEPAEVERPVPLEAVSMPEPRAEPPESLADICTTEAHDRASHSYGKSYRDLIRAFRGRFDHPPDVVAYPRDDAEVAAVLEWCGGSDLAAVPYGGGTSVVGGVEPAVGDGYAGAVSIDLKRLDRVLEVDPVSRAALIQAGATGPGLEDQLRPHGLTLRHFPQSFELSTLGGWIATRAGGHFATLLTHIDDMVESIRAITPAGVWESRRLPGSGAGPSPDRMLIGSEGTLGAITQAWVRLQARPEWKVTASVRFATFREGAAAVRALTQSGLWPSNCRLLDAEEAALSTPAAGAGGSALLVLGFESADHPVDQPMARALECCADHGGTSPDGPRFTRRSGGGEGGRGDEKRRRDGGKGGDADAWRSAFLRMPYMRDTMLAAGVMSETFETAITWDRLDDFIDSVRGRVEDALRDVYGAGRITCRFTHCYPDGAAPYFTLLAPATRGAELEQWDAVKSAASEAVLEGGGTITHHHAVGRDHRRWYDRQRPDPFAAALRAAKEAVDPAGILNPGVLVDPLSGAGRPGGAG